MARQQVQQQEGPRSIWMREGLLIAVASACAYVLVSLLSYHEGDPGWSATGNGGAVRNLGGPAGAWLADVCFSLLGYLAYLIPVLLAYRAAMIFAERDRPWLFSWTGFSIRLCGLVLVLLAGTALAALNYGNGGALPQGAGGVMGHATAAAMRDAFSAFGGRLLLLAVFLFRHNHFHRPQLAGPHGPPWRACAVGFRDPAPARGGAHRRPPRPAPAREAAGGPAPGDRPSCREGEASQAAEDQAAAAAAGNL
jgi:hypothetical protein